LTIKAGGNKSNNILTYLATTPGAFSYIYSTRDFCVIRRRPRFVLQTSRTSKTGGCRQSERGLETKSRRGV